MMTCYVCYLNRTLTRNFAAVTGGTGGAPESPLLHLSPGRGELPLEGPPAGAPAVHTRDSAVDPTSDNHAQHPSSGQWICRSRCQVATKRHVPGPRGILCGEYYQRLRHHQKSR